VAGLGRVPRPGGPIWKVVGSSNLAHYQTSPAVARRRRWLGDPTALSPSEDWRTRGAQIDATGAARAIDNVSLPNLQAAHATRGSREYRRSHQCGVADVSMRLRAGRCRHDPVDAAKRGHCAFRRGGIVCYCAPSAGRAAAKALWGARPSVSLSQFRFSGRRYSDLSMCAPSSAHVAISNQRNAISARRSRSDWSETSLAASKHCAASFRYSSALLMSARSQNAAPPATL
jgi:hypothetical protein